MKAAQIQGNSLDPVDCFLDNECRELASRILDMLGNTERRVVELHLGFNGPEMTFEAIGKLPEFGLSKERIRQIYNKALHKVRRHSRIMSEVEAYADFVY